MLQAEIEEPGYVLVVQRVEGHLPIAPIANQPHLAELAQVVGDGGLGGSRDDGQIADTELALRQGPNDLQPGGIGQYLEGVGDEGELLVAAEAG